MPDGILNLLKLLFLALLYLFLARVLRVVSLEVSGRRPPAPAPLPDPAAARPAAGAPARSGGALQLKVLEPKEAEGHVYPLADELTVGRAPGCGVVLDDTYASQLHARIYKQNGQLYLEDLGSTNGTYVNRQRVTAAVRLRRGDRLQIGTTVMEVAR